MATLQIFHRIPSELSSFNFGIFAIMNDGFEKLLGKIKFYITALFAQRSKLVLAYHNFRHSETVVARAFEIAQNYSLGDQDLFSLITAAWFHDTGHLFNELQEHEKAGADLMAAFLKTFLVDEAVIKTVADCIRATKMPSNPQSMIEKIICDADTYHFGTKEFIKTNPAVYTELECRLGIAISDKIARSIHLLESHQFYTNYCQDLLNNGKKANIAFLRHLSPDALLT